jgi:hypothetical protein
MGSQQRWVLFWLWVLTSFCVLGTLAGCQGVTPSISEQSAPFFVPRAEDAPRLEILTHELDRQALTCVQTATCEQISFARALVSLFENQDAARASFRHVLEYSSASPLATSSRLWLRVLEESALVNNGVEGSPLTDILAPFVREWMESQVSERSTVGKPLTPVVIQEPRIAHPRFIEGLQKKVRDRDRQIAVLRGQLEALKSIDQEHAGKQRKVKPPASLGIGQPSAD